MFGFLKSQNQSKFIVIDNTNLQREFRLQDAWLLLNMMYSIDESHSGLSFSKKSYGFTGSDEDIATPRKDLSALFDTNRFTHYKNNQLTTRCQQGYTLFKLVNEKGQTIALMSGYLENYQLSDPKHQEKMLALFREKNISQVESMPHFHFLNLVIHPHFRHQGFFKKLMQHVVTWLNQNNILLISYTLSVESQQTNLAFYHRIRNKAPVISCGNLPNKTTSMVYSHAVSDIKKSLEKSAHPYLKPVIIGGTLLTALSIIWFLSKKEIPPQRVLKK